MREYKLVDHVLSPGRGGQGSYGGRYVLRSGGGGVLVNGKGPDREDQKHGEGNGGGGGGGAINGLPGLVILEIGSG